MDEKGGNNMFNKILVPIDGSNASFKAAELARDFLKNNCAKKVTLIHVAQYPQDTLQLENFYTQLALPGLREELIEKIEESSQNILKQASAKFDSSMNVDTLILYGPPAEIICDTAVSEHYDLIIIGNRGLNKLQRFLMGSISNRVSTLAKCPVLIVKE